MYIDDDELRVRMALLVAAEGPRFRRHLFSFLRVMSAISAPFRRNELGKNRSTRAESK